jgi:hypothetical protein
MGNTSVRFFPVPAQTSAPSLVSDHLSNLVAIEFGEPDDAMRAYGHSLGIALSRRYRELGERASHTHSSDAFT